MLIPPVSRYMTMAPQTIAPREHLSVARELMRTANVHHLPVVEGGRLVGILSDRDLLRVWVPLEDTVRDAMREPVVIADPEQPLDQVVELMTTQAVGSVVLVHVHEGSVAGIFTIHDALRALDDFMRRNVRCEA